MARGILLSRRCQPVTRTTPLLSSEEIARLRRYAVGWKPERNHRLVQCYDYGTFDGATGFMHKVGRLAVREGHYPEMYIRSRPSRRAAPVEVEVIIWTESRGGLTLNDFILAAKINWAAGFR